MPTELSIVDPVGTWAWWLALSAAVAVVWRPPGGGAVAEVRLHAAAVAEVRLHEVAAEEEWAAISAVSLDGQPRSATASVPLSASRHRQARATAGAAFVLADVGSDFTAGSGCLVARSGGRIARTDLRAGWSPPD